ncbi:DUF3846 domain-containing protein [Rhodococcoides yunnanense]|uniref:DUF3846 domain-containing protein n=1 Tax=Rhodococcoides yunnanense TaxID=278209 RepID=UPI0022B1EC1B|nr:DUF3846 domain-containing protein [Rhodococcus yunnanensis]MCZ4277748.1 DUF3846 domain-containing protein [Rhodococcus yunnanensis]
MRIVKITPTGTTLTTVDGDLTALQSLVGGDLQWIPLGDDSAMYVNENGRYLRMPENPIATRLCLHYRAGLDPADAIAGLAVVVGVSPHDGAEADCPDTVVRTIRDLGFTVDH